MPRKARAQRGKRVPTGRIQMTLEDVKIDADPIVLAGMAHELVRNPDFRNAFEKNPSQVLQKVGFQLPKGVEMAVDPTQLSIALSDIQREDLDEIAALVAPAVRVLSRPVTRVGARVATGTRPGVSSRVATSPATETRVSTNPATQTRVTTSPATRTRVSTRPAISSHVAANVGIEVAARTVSILERVEPGAREAVVAELSRRIEETGRRARAPRPRRAQKKRVEARES